MPNFWDIIKSSVSDPASYLGNSVSDPASDAWDKIFNPAAEDEQNEREAIAGYKGLEGEYTTEYEGFVNRINELFENNPQLDLTDFQNILSGFSSDLGDIRTRTESGVAKYLAQGSERTSAMLDEVMSSTGDYLSGYKKLARTEDPAMSLYRDQAGANIGSNLQNLRGMGVRSQSGIVDILKSGQQTDANMAIQAGQYKTQAMKDLNNAYLTYGTTRGNALNTAAQFSQNAAGTRLNTGAFSASVTGQQANIAGLQSGMEKDMFQNNEMTPWMMEQQWNQNQAATFNPLAFRERLYTDLAGYYDQEGDEKKAAARQFKNDIEGYYQEQVNSAGEVFGAIGG